jgi:hypothetical protein
MNGIVNFLRFIWEHKYNKINNLTDKSKIDDETYLVLQSILRIMSHISAVITNLNY